MISDKTKPKAVKNRLGLGLLYDIGQVVATPSIELLYTGPAQPAKTVSRDTDVASSKHSDTR